MSDTNHIETPAPARPRKSRGKRAAKPKVPNELLGLTGADCCLGCSAERCVISAKAYCAHPRKGGLHGPEMVDKAALERASKAKKMLAHAAVDRRRA